MGINVLFLYPNTFGMNMVPPAIAMFSALLKKHGHSVDIFDSTYYQLDYGIDSDGSKVERLNVIPYDLGEKGIKRKTSNWSVDLEKQVHSFKPDLIAISSTEDMWELGIYFLESIRSYIELNATPVIAGGVFPTFAPELCLQHDLIHMVCVGEGENALIDLCDRIEMGRPYVDVTNLWIKLTDGKIKRNLISKPVDINQNPKADMSLFEEARLYRPMAGKIYKMFPIETHRGCPFTCRFCNSPDQMRLDEEKSTGGFFRKKSMALVYEELRDLKENSGCEYNYFWADTFLALNTKEFDEFCEMYSEINLPFWMQTRPETITEYKIDKLASIGLHRISFGIEHGNEAFRKKHLDRKWKNSDIIEVLQIPGRYGVQFSVNNIVGVPHETRKVAFDTIELNRKIPADNHNIYSFMPFHGTPLRRVCEDLGLIDKSTITKCATDKTILNMTQFPPHEIEGIKKCFVLYVKFPKERWTEIEAAEKETPVGLQLFKDLSDEYRERYSLTDDSDPHGVVSETADLEYGVAGTL